MTDAPTHKTISPYDLTSGDNPGAVISQPFLTGSNYDDWALHFRMALSSRKKYGFLDGSITKPAAGSPHSEDWIANNHLIVRWIKLTIEPKLRSTITTREIAKDLWDMIRKRFSVKSGARLQQLRISLSMCKQNGLTVDAYFGQLTRLWDGIKECTTEKRCECGLCTCDLNSARDKEHDVLRVHDFLAGLDDSVHGSVRSQIYAISPLPDLDSVYQTILQNETINSTKIESELISFATQIHQLVQSSVNKSSFTQQQCAPSSRNGSTNKDPSRLCSYCGRSEHERAGCFKLIGYPDWWEEKPQNKHDTRSVGRGRGRGNTPQANTTQIITNAAEVNQPSLPLTENDRQGLCGFIDEQWRTLQQMFGKSKPTDRLSGKSRKIPMTGRGELFRELRIIPHVSIRLPAGSDVLTTQLGTITLYDGLCLNNVYLVPDFHANLISLGQLVTDNNLIVQLTDRLLILQDQTSRMLIGAGDREGEGLYRLHENEIVSSCHTRVLKDPDIWHTRMGHASSRALGQIPDISFSSSDFSNNDCDVCFRAKQTRMSFQDSSNNAMTIFYLIHCDVWGPYRTPSFCGSRYFLTIVDDCSRAVWVYLLQNKSSLSRI